MRKAIALMSVLLLAGCAASRAGTRNPQWAASIEAKGVPNLFKVDEMLYRSAQPSTKGMKAIEALSIKTVINLCPMNSDQNEAAGTSLRLERVKVAPWQIKDEDVVAVMRILSKKENGPFLIHCRRGSDRTGLMCAMYRIVYQGWTKKEALDEMIYGGYGYNTVWRNIKGYIEKVDVDKTKREIGQRGE